MKRIVCILFMILQFISCNNYSNHITLFDQLQGMWQINNEPRIFTLSNNEWTIIHLYNKIEAKGYIFIPHHIPSINNNTSLLWCNQTDSGIIEMESQINDVTIENRPSYLMKGLPYSNHTVDTLHKIVDISIN